MTSGDTPAHRPVVDDLVDHNREFGRTFEWGGRRANPSRAVAVVTCMDARIEPLSALGLEVGEAHIIRNGGGVVTDDVIRSLSLSQRSLGTREIIVMHHTKCGLEGVDEAGFLADLERETGVVPTWSVGGFADAATDVRDSILRLRENPFVPYTDDVSGFVYDVDDGLLRRVDV